MNNVKVSIIIPTYGGPKLLTRALDSVKSQTYNDWEVIIVDDNGLGTHNQIETAMAISSYLADERFRYIAHEVNKNGSAARNTGFVNSSGNYIALLDDDDEYLPKYLESQVQCLARQSSNCGMVYCSYYQYFEGIKQKTVYAEKRGRLLYDTFMHSFEIPTSSWLVKRTVFEELGGFDESFKRHQDWEFLNRLAAKYEIQPNYSACYNRYISYRNSPRNSIQSIEYRNHYLNKMKDYIALLPSSQQKQVVISNQIDSAIPLIKEKKYIKFIQFIWSTKSGIYGMKYLIKRLVG